MGFDTEYMQHWDRNMLHEALQSGRIVLTRSRSAARKRGHVLIESDHIGEQLSQMNRMFALQGRTRLFTRCNICNEPLICVKQSDVKGLVPEYVYSTQKDFARCPKCCRIYWKGTHPKRSMETINSIITSREES